LVFISSKKKTDKAFEALESQFGSEMGVIHSNKSQNYRIRSIEQFDDGTNRILLATDVMARGLDLDKITHVINFDTPAFPENYMHRIGRTGRAKQEGKSILFFTKTEKSAKEAIEKLMNYQIPLIDFPDDVDISIELLPEEKPSFGKQKNPNRNYKEEEKTSGFHEKKEKNRKENLGGSYRRTLAKKYKKKLTKGDKIQNRRKKK
jgi:ATP-dependent RNA helicase RhlE